MNATVAIISIQASFVKGLETLRWSVAKLNQDLEIIAISSVVQEGPELKAVIKASTSLAAEDILEVVLKAERRATLENPNVFFKALLLGVNSEVITSPKIVLPHPSLIKTPYLFMAKEVWPDFWHPILAKKLHDVILEDLAYDAAEFFAQGKSLL